MTEEQLAEQMFLNVHPGEVFADQPWDVRSRYFQSARLVQEVP